MGLDEILFSSEEEWVDEDSEEEHPKQVSASYACDECDYRWDVVSDEKLNYNDLDGEDEIICPMCGSMNITQI